MGDWDQAVAPQQGADRDWPPNWMGMKPRMDGEKIQVYHLPVQQGMEGEDGDFSPLPVMLTNLPRKPRRNTKQKKKAHGAQIPRNHLFAFNSPSVPVYRKPVI